MRGGLGLRLIGAVLLAIFGSGVVGFNVFYGLFSWITVGLSYFVVGIFHSGVLEGNTLLVSGEIIEFVPACIAASAYLLLGLLILLTRGISFLKGVLLFVVGSLLILVGNVVRIEILVSFLLSGVNYFETLHLLFWKILSSVYVVLVWVFLSWLFKVKEIPVYGDLKYLRDK